MGGHGHDNHGHGHGSEGDEIVWHQEKIGGVFILAFLTAILTLAVLAQAGNTKLTLLTGKDAYDKVQAQMPKIEAKHEGAEHGEKHEEATNKENHENKPAEEVKKEEAKPAEVTHEEPKKDEHNHEEGSDHQH
ncbi:MAG: hypothetical protein U0457_06750 [Candidatus Sericytochromatia bacterium]